MHISILIISKKYKENNISTQKAKLLQAEGVNVEILLAEGDNPSLQRNELAQIAGGEYLLFLDEDSDPDEHLLSTYHDLIKKFPHVSIFGGPSLLKIKKAVLQEVLKFFFSSFLGIGPFKSRYNSVGSVRMTDEKELILSNMLIKKDHLINLGGFNRNHYPGEENEFLNRDDRPVIYSPDAKVYRFPRETIKEFLLQMFFYGQGRAKHLCIASRDSIFFLPAFFSLSFFVIFAVYLFHQNPNQNVGLFLIPFTVYLIVIMVATIARFKFQIKLLAVSALCFGLGHFAYGLGICTGLIRFRILGKFFNHERQLSYLSVVRLKEFK